MANQTPQILWEPSDDFIQNSNIKDFERWLFEKKGLAFKDYDQLWEWSVNHLEDFWEALLAYFQISSSGSYTSVVSNDSMPHIRWFEGLTLNYAEHIFKDVVDNDLAIIFKREGRGLINLSWFELKVQVASFADFLRSKGVTKGDRVVALIPCIPEATIGFLAACSIGAVWSSCSPDFGTQSVVDRFQQIEPKVFITVDGYHYNGRVFNKIETVKEVIGRLDKLVSVVQIPYLQNNKFLDGADLWCDLICNSKAQLTFERVPFSHPIWILYSSGTTGAPKAITHSQGGVLLEHLKYVSFHNDVKKGDRYFWFTTTGWMMWNYVQATMLAGATLVLYDGSPGYPDMGSLWQFAADVKINHFGTSAPYILACSKSNVEPSQFNLSALKSISSTGSPLPAEGFRWIFDNVKKDIWFCSMSGGTDVCSAFVGGCPTKPLYEGEIQGIALGCSLSAFNDLGEQLIGEVGEMVIDKPMPSMPIYFWGDLDKARYQESYFDTYPNVWRHGDWVKITDRKTILILGRSDATLNRHGIRIGSAEIYQSVNKIQGIRDSIVVNIEMEDGSHHMPLFVLMDDDLHLSDDLTRQIANQLKEDFTSRHVPDKVIQVQDLPYTLSGKKMETIVKKILMGMNMEKVLINGGIRNPESLSFFSNYRDELVTAK